MSMEPTRRSFLKKGTAAAIGLGLHGETRSASANSRLKVGIVGGGMAGVSCAWLLDGVADVVLFESRPSLGGHTHSIAVPVGGQQIIVDVGAQFFARGPHPTYSKLLEIIGLTRPDDPTRNTTIDTEMSITLMEARRGSPRFVSPASKRFWPVLARWNRDALIAFFVFAVAARKFTKNGDWLVRLDTWLANLPVREDQKERVLLPLLSAMVGCSMEQARGLSARSVLVFVGEALPENLLRPFLYSKSLIGMGGNVLYLAGISGNLTTYSGAPVKRVRRLRNGGFEIRNSSGAHEHVDVVVFATPPYITRRLLPRRPALRRAAKVLGLFDYFHAEISIHRDPVYMPRKRRFWSAYNPLVHEGYSEASVWYGALQPGDDGQAPPLLFKSWATARAQAPRREVFRRAFLHPLITPDFIHAQRRLAHYQGWDGVWFAGSYTHEVDSQETALLSAMNVVRELYPRAPNLLALEG